LSANNQAGLLVFGEHKMRGIEVDDEAVRKAANLL
jgi:hypothetical protein